MKKPPAVHIDYLSFTWSPDMIHPYRKLARKGGYSFAQFIKHREEIGEPLDIERIEVSMVHEFKRFFINTSKDIFAGCEYTTTDMWEEHFHLRPRLQGVFGYKQSWDIMIDTSVIGIAATGANQGSFYVSITGGGCAMLDMQKLRKIMQSLPFIKITRVDLALDDYHGLTSFQLSREAWISGDFKNSARNPKCSVIQSGGEVADDGEITYLGGSTFYVGSRQSGKLYRGYEKGRQMGNPDSKWFRHELEIRSADREIPLSVLTDPDTYFVGSYPYMATVHQIITSAAVMPSRIKTAKRSARAVYENSVTNLRHSAGAMLNIMRNAKGLTDSEIVDQLIRDTIPRRLRALAMPGVNTQENKPCQYA